VKSFAIGNRRGTGMVLALFVMMILFGLGISYLMAGSSSLVSARRDVLRARALACAEAGVERAVKLLLTDPPGEFRTSHPSANPDNHTADTWYTETVTAGESFRVCVRDGTGIFTGKVVITSEGTVTDGGATVSRTVKVVVTTNQDNVSVWNNVIFGGVGQACRSINGNVAIRGSMHLLGDGEDFTDVDGDGRWDDNETYTDSDHNGHYDLGEPYTDTDHDGHRDAQEPFVDANGNGTRDPALTVTDMAEELSGTANVGNNYNGMPADLHALLPALEQVSYGGEVVDSLDAKLRVKHGKVNISGSATVGDPNVHGNTTKETLDGVYVSDGFGGNKGAASVYSDNGTTAAYDLGDGAVDMPLIDTGSYTKDGVTYSNYLDYLNQNATVYNGDLAITNGTPLIIIGPKGTLVVDGSGHVNITGIVYINGNISFGPAKSRIIYSGVGTLVTPNSVNVHADVVPAHTFPTTDAIGLIAGDRINLATGSGDAHLTMALAMYAQHQVVCNKQSDIAGTIVSSYYSMSNVPKLYQVPELADHLPPGMPGAEPIWIAGVTIESWQDVLNP
jgi:hypothetical protein